MTEQQEAALRDLCERYRVDFDQDNYKPGGFLPEGYVSGWVGPIFVGCDSDGRISS